MCRVKGKERDKNTIQYRYRPLNERQGAFYRRNYGMTLVQARAETTRNTLALRNVRALAAGREM